MSSTRADSRGEAWNSLLLKLQDAVYSPVAPLEITAWVTPEPVPFPDRERGEKAVVAVGQLWGRRLFDCAWMRFRARLPSGVAGPLVARVDINGELCIVDASGLPVRGLTNVKSTFDPTLGGPAKTIFRWLPEMERDGVLEFWADCGLNDLFGFVKDNGVVVLAEVARCREDIRQLYYDVETLRDYRMGLALGSHRAAALDAAREDVSGILAQLEPAAVEKARAILRPWFQAGGDGSLTVHAVGHAHLDLAWLWPLRETLRKGARTFATALYNLERYPEYVYGCSQPQLFAWMKESYPSLYGKIKEQVRAGRIEPLGTFWVEPDCNMPSGEALVRQIKYGAAFFREEFGVEPDFCWEPDVFGYNGQLPQILRKSGHTAFMTQKLSWNVVNKFPYHSFRWEGIDGTRILAHMLPEETYNSPAAARSLAKIAATYHERNVSKHALLVFGIGDGGGGPDAEHLERLRRAPGLPEMPVVKLESAAAFFQTWSRDSAALPVWKGELYLERHQGTLTTQGKIKRFNRRAEIALREAEWAAFLAARLAGQNYPSAALDRLWKEVLLFQFHDILPGSSIKRVYDECAERYERILGELAALQRCSYEAASRSTPAGHVAFNSLAWPRREWASVAGNWRRVDVPALGWAVVPPSLSAFIPPQADERRLENEKLRVTLAEDGRISSLFDKRASREVIAPGEFANDLVVIPDKGDAWDFETDHKNKDVCLYLRQPVQRPKLAGCVAQVDGPCARLEQVWRFGSSEIRQTIRLMSGDDELHVETDVDWRETATMLRVRFPVAVASDEARFEIPFGSVTRSTRENTSERLAQLEVAALQWVDLSQADYGVALLNDCKYGFRVKGHTLDMSLIRSVPHPGAALVDKDDKSESASGGAVFGDLGQHHFRYALYPHEGPAVLPEITARARRLNTPLPVVSDALPPASEPLFTLSSPAIEVAAITPRADGWALRLVNLEPREVTVELAAADSATVWRESDLLERAAEPCVPGDSSPNSARLVFHPFEIKTALALSVGL